MFKACCGECGECWYIGNPRTCTCPDETTQRPWVGLTDEEVIEIAFESADRESAVIQTIDKLKEKNNG